ncbi:sensor histidine kinase [Paenibacillus sp. NPDC058071]|uniref:sensor histidine kinase n=1 Tax=Paenibacillus sp. NPDC058071 TaxID=3346326 RepID=UPI0036D9C3A6
MFTRINAGKLGYMPIGYKLTLSYMVFTVILVSVNGYVSHSMYDTSMREQTRQNIQGTMLQIRDNVAYKADDMTRISTTLYEDYSLVQSLRANESYLGGNYKRMTEVIMPKLDNASKSIGLSLRLSVYFHNESVNEVYHRREDGNSVDIPEQTYDIYHMKRIIDKSWYKQLPEEQYSATMQWSQIEQDAGEDRISLIRRMVDTNNPLKLEEVGIMRFSVKLADLFDSVDYMKLGKGSVLLVKDSAGQIIYTSADPESELSDHTPDNGFMTIDEKMGRQDWTITAHVPITVIKQEAVKVQNYIIGICMLCFVLFTFAGGFISRYFSKRITKFVSVLNAFREGDLHKRIAYRGKDEFAQIAHALNGMGAEIEALINKVYLTQLQKKEGELEMLQLQINPHFLYNTLSSINQLAKFGQTEKLQKMVVELAKFYRLTLNSGRSLIPVTLELEQTGAYIAIQKVKYGSRMEVDFDIDAAVWPYETVKLILQPFIENVLKHAWSGDRIHIRVIARKSGDDIIYRIIDDGMGMRQERFNEILDPYDERNTGCGIRNIDQRIKLHYGSQYGVTIGSRIGIGTSVQIRIPAKRRKLVRNHNSIEE